MKRHALALLSVVLLAGCATSRSNYYSDEGSGDYYYGAGAADVVIDSSRSAYGFGGYALFQRRAWKFRCPGDSTRLVSSTNGPKIGCTNPSGADDAFTACTEPICQPPSPNAFRTDPAKAMIQAKKNRALRGFFLSARHAAR